MLEEMLLDDTFLHNPLETPKTFYLNKYTDNLTAKVRANVSEFQVIGREKEIEDVITSLLRKSKSSPLLIGEAGVGKTAILEGLAVRIEQGDVPKKLQNLTVRSLELSNILNDSDGGFIAKFKGIIDDMVSSYGENLLFIDEIHTIVGTGGSENSALDAGNILKPVLARGEIQIVGATTIDEFHEFIEKDRALQRRFQTVHVNEPSIAKCIEILRGSKGKFEQYHEVVVQNEALVQAVQLSTRYIPDRFLPDKAFDLLDEACTRVSTRKFNRNVGKREIAEVLKNRTGIPVTTILQNDNERVNNLEEKLEKRVKGQNHAISEVADAIRIAQAGLQDETKPIASFLFLGTTGVGKTELAKALASMMFDDDEAMIRFDMSEYSQEGSSLKLIGTRETKGHLTEAVKHKPYSIVLFDELEKADTETHDLLLQILDDGRLTDGTGRVVSFKNTIVILTTNKGAELIKNNQELKPNGMTEREERQFLNGIDNELAAVFRPEFINRIEHKIVFKMLSKEVIKEIAEKNLAILTEKMARQNAEFHYDPDLLEYLADNGVDPKNGARPLARLMKTKVIAPISRELLARKGKNLSVHVSVSGNAPSLEELEDKRKLVFDVVEL